MTPEQYCQDKAAKSGSSFYYSFLFLPQDRRRAITALYAFCREVDDVVDECSDPALAQTKLNWWRAELTQLFGGTPQHPVTQALLPALKQFNLPESHLREIIDGMQMDLARNRYDTFEELALYCHRVAGVVGLLAAEIFGRTKDETRRFAELLGTAFQLTNIIRDVGEDARRNRIYLPLEDLARFGIEPEEILRRQPSRQFSKLLRFEIDRAQDYYTQAHAALPVEDRRSQRPSLVMSAIYQALLGEVAAARVDVLTHRASIAPIRKLWIAWRTWLRT